MEGTLLNKAAEWFTRAVRLESEGKIPMMQKCIDNMVKYEAEGIAAGESWVKGGFFK